LAVFAALLALTFVTVIVAGLHLPRREAIPLGLAIAAVKACLIGAIFMHLWGERRIVFRVLCFAAAVAAALMTFSLLDARHRGASTPTHRMTK
jgi:caa(3)-type oxidase subunit IV